MENEKVIETPESKLAEISKEIVRVERDAIKIVIVQTQEQYENASKFLSDVVKPRLNRVKEIMEFFVAPHQEARKKALAEMKKIEELFNKQLQPLLKIEISIKTAMSGYLRVQEEAARKEEERLRKLREKQDERREEKGLEPIMIPLPTVTRPETMIRSESGSKTMAGKVWKFEIVSYSELPQSVINEVLVLAKDAGIHEKVVRKMVNAGVREISGVRIFEDFDIRTSATK